MEKDGFGQPTVSTPPIYGRSAGGTVIDPSGFW
jgi:hypothetical protein